MDDGFPDNVISLPVITSLRVDPQRVLATAHKETLDTVIIIGWDKEGSLYFASSEPDGPEVLWLLEMAKMQLLKAGSEDG